MHVFMLKPLIVVFLLERLIIELPQFIYDNLNDFVDMNTVLHLTF